MTYKQHKRHKKVRSQTMNVRYQSQAIKTTFLQNTTKIGTVSNKRFSLIIILLFFGCILMVHLNYCQKRQQLTADAVKKYFEICNMGDFQKGPKAYQTRRITFSACHRLHSPALTDDENKQIYGKCNHINGHGHNYIVNVTLFGEIDVRTGMIMNMTNLKKYMEDAIMRPMDHKNLDKDVSFFQTRPSTTENVAVYIWSRMKEIMDQPSLLYEVEIHETKNNVVRYRGD